MIEAVIDPKLWGYISKAVGSVMTEIQLTFSPDGLTINQITSDKSVMIGVVVPKSEFSQYDCSAERLIILNMDQVTKIAKRLSNTAGVGLSHDENGPDNNLFQLTLTADDNKRVFNIPIFAPEADYKKKSVPYNLEFESEFTITGTTFKSIIEDLQIFGTKGKFMVDKDAFKTRSEADGSEALVVYKIGKELTSLDKKHDNVLSAVFSLGALHDICEAIVEKKEEIMVKLSHNKPIWIELPVGDKSKLVLLLSPIVDMRMSDE